MNQHNSARKRPGISIIELVIIIVIIAMLIAFLIPFAQLTRVKSAETQSINNLKNIGLAIHGFHDANRRLPFNGVTAFVPATNIQIAYSCQAVPNSFTSGSWAFQISPYMDEGPIFVDPNKSSVGGATYMCSMRTRPKTCTGNPTFTAIPAGNVNNIPQLAIPELTGGDKSRPWSDYGLNPFLNMSVDLKINNTKYSFAKAEVAQGNGLVNCQDTRRTLVGITDGTSNTVFVGQMSMDPRDYPKSAYVADVAAANNVSRTLTYCGTFLLGGSQATALPNAFLARDTEGQPTTSHKRPWGSSSERGVYWAMGDATVRLFPYAMGGDKSTINNKTGVGPGGTFASFMTPTGGEAVTLPE